MRAITGGDSRPVLMRLCYVFIIFWLGGFRFDSRTVGDFWNCKKKYLSRQLLTAVGRGTANRHIFKDSLIAVKFSYLQVLKKIIYYLIFNIYANNMTYPNNTQCTVFLRKYPFWLDIEFSYFSTLSIISCLIVKFNFQNYDGFQR